MVGEGDGEVAYAGGGGIRGALEFAGVGCIAAFRVVVFGAAGVREEGEVPERGVLRLLSTGSREDDGERLGYIPRRFLEAVSEIMPGVGV